MIFCTGYDTRLIIILILVASLVLASNPSFSDAHGASASAFSMRHVPSQAPCNGLQGAMAQRNAANQTGNTGADAFTIR